MNSIRSILCVGLALAAMAFTMSAPAVAATPTDPGIYEAVKASIETPAVLQVYDDHVALTCESPAAIVIAAAVRSSFPVETVNLAETNSSRIRLVKLRRRC